jgi:hypothetical protein
MPPNRAPRKSAPAEMRSREEESDVDGMEIEDFGDLDEMEKNLKSSMAAGMSARVSHHVRHHGVEGRYLKKGNGILVLPGIVGMASV